MKRRLDVDVPRMLVARRIAWLVVEMEPDGAGADLDPVELAARQSDQFPAIIVLLEVGERYWFRSQTIRRPSSVSSGSSFPIVFECGAISSARPPVATTGAS